MSLWLKEIKSELFWFWLNYFCRKSITNFVGCISCQLVQCRYFTSFRLVNSQSVDIQQYAITGILPAAWCGGVTSHKNQLICLVHVWLWTKFIESSWLPVQSVSFIYPLISCKTYKVIKSARAQSVLANISVELRVSSCPKIQNPKNWKLENLQTPRN